MSASFLRLFSTGFLYTDFVQSIILLVFLNPYRIGDRVRIDGEAQYVKRITTYFTEFESLHGKPVSRRLITSKMSLCFHLCVGMYQSVAAIYSP